MNRTPSLVVPLWLDRANERVFKGKHPLRLTPKAFRVLNYLLVRPDLLSTKDELFAAVWPGTAVTEASLSTCIREIRRVLEDDAAAPRYIQTVHRRGYRYVGPILDGPSAAHAPRMRQPVDPLLVGRDRELASLSRALERVEGGALALVLIAGEPGVGKTTLIDGFTAGVVGRLRARIARGQCVDQYGVCEAYLPWFDVLNHLARDHGREWLAALLRRCAPMWLAQLPWLVDANERQQLQREIAGATRERMIRELAEALAALTVDRSMVIVLEDLHWSDPSSIGLLGYLARRSRPGRLMLVGTYRPEELHASSHPLAMLKQELLLHGACDHLALDFLTTEAVAEYVRSRFPGVPDEVARHVHRRTDGNPLFMVNLVDYLLARGVLVRVDDGWHVRGIVDVAETEVPESLREMIERQVDRLVADERRVLEAASVAGAAFSAAAVAAVLEEPVENAEEQLALLARRGAFVVSAELQTWPDGTQSDSYAFIHALYQNVLYERMGTARRSRMHRLAGDRLELAYGARAHEIAAELALHFQRGQDWRRAVSCFTQAGESAIWRGAHIEAIALLNHGLDLISKLPAGIDRDACEVQLRVPLGVCYINTRGYAAPEVAITFERAHELSRHAEDTSHVFRALRGLFFVAVQRAELRKAQSMAEELLRVAAREGDASRLAEAHRIMGATWFHLGCFAPALEHLQHGLAFVERHSQPGFQYGQDPGVCSHVWLGWTQWYLGYPDQALASATRGIELARQIGHPYSLAYAMNFVAQLHHCRGEAAATERYSAEAIECARGHGLTILLGMGQVLHGWSRAVLGGDEDAIAELQEGVARWESTGARLVTPYWRYLLAAALDHVGRHAEAGVVVDAALAQFRSTNERWVECELYLLKAALAARIERGRSRSAGVLEAERHLRRALKAATEMESPSLQLRAATALTRLVRDQERRREAEVLVRTTYAAFSEGFQTSDLLEAQAILSGR